MKDNPMYENPGNSQHLLYAVCVDTKNGSEIKGKVFIRPGKTFVQRRKIELQSKIGKISEIDRK